MVVAAGELVAIEVGSHGDVDEGVLVEEILGYRCRGVEVDVAALAVSGGVEPKALEVVGEVPREALAERVRMCLGDGPAHLPWG